MAQSGLAIEMLPARHGDALWVEWGPDDDRHRMLVDGGPRQTYEVLRDRFEALDPDDRHVDLLVVTHIDLDHIEGVIQLLRDASLGITYDDIWFNGYRHLPGPDERGAIQGEFMSAVLLEGRFPWNKAFGGDAAVVAAHRVLPSVKLPGGLELVLVGPTEDKLAKLKEKWVETLEDANLAPEDRAAALERLEQRLGPMERGGRKSFGGDGSEANGSSIAFIAEFGSERWLLAGDAHVETLRAGLEQYGRQHGEWPVRLDGFKLPHHGSTNNVDPQLMDAIDCRRFLVSTNGAYFKHPDEACIDLVVSSSDRPELVFNYHSRFTSPWAVESDDYTAVFLDEDDDATVTRDVAAEHVETPETPSEPSPPAPSPLEPTPSGQPPSAAPDPDQPGSEPSGTTSPTERIELSVTHGSLEAADDAVLVGHYRATPLAGAEGFVDGRFEGRLSDRVAGGSYPGELGEWALILPPRRRQPIGGVLVVGLGEYGELTPLRLVETVRLALVDHALDRADRSEHDGPVELSISSVLLGVRGDQALTVGASVRAIVHGVTEANRTLRAGDHGARARYSAVDFWEYDSNNAEQAYRAVLAVAAEPRSSDVEYTVGGELGQGPGALENSSLVESPEKDWWRIRVADKHIADHPDSIAPEPYLEFEFTVTGRLARAGTVTHTVERRRLERLLRSSVDRAKPSTELHTILFEMLFPNQLKWDLKADREIQLEVDDSTADIPWEMLAARNPEQGERGPLALRAPMVRQLRLGAELAVQRSRDARALVVGNPPSGRDDLPPLDGALREANAVIEVIGRSEERTGYQVTPLCFESDRRADATTTAAVEHALFEHDYRIVHIAGHGLYEPDDPTRTGVVIGPDAFITAKVLGQLNVVPDLVFLNCCHLGAVTMGRASGAIEFTRSRLNRLGASLARQLIASGVRAVVVAGWAVADDAAEAFASTFYQQMLSGRPFGQAVHAARLAAHRAASDHSTWGAYQCYGDAGYRLPLASNDRDRSPDVEPPVTTREAMRRLEALVDEIERVGSPRRFRPELVMIEQTVLSKGGRWLGKGSGRLSEQLAEAWAAVGELEKAIDWYQRALDDVAAVMSLRGVEQLANFRDRLATQLTRAENPSAEDRERAAEMLAQSQRSIELLQALRPNVERGALWAGHHKRRATATEGEARARAIRDAADAYLGAYRNEEKMAEMSQREADAYTLLNFIQLEEIRSRIEQDDSRAQEFEDRLAELCAMADDGGGDYWVAVRCADSMLTSAIVSDDVPARVDDLIARYRRAFDVRSTAGQRSSTRDHLFDLAVLHPDESQSAALHSLYDALDADGN